MRRQQSSRVSSTSVAVRRPTRWGAVAASIVERSFDFPTPLLVWTGDGVRRDRNGRLQSIRHAMEADDRHPADVVDADVPKLLLLQILHAQSHEEVRAWLTEHGAAAVPAERVGLLLGAARSRLSTGDEIVIAYEPRQRRTRIVWPWGLTSDVDEPAFMRSVWRWSFGGTDQPELRQQLLRWMQR